MYLWGKSRHIQSILLSIVGRFGTKEATQKKRVELIDVNGAVISYDMFFKDPDALIKVSNHLKSFNYLHIKR